MKSKRLWVIFCCSIMLASLLINIILGIKLYSLGVGKSCVEFYSAVGSKTSIGVIKEQTMVKWFGKDWKSQRLFQRKLADSKGFYLGNYRPIPVGTSPLLISPTPTEAYYQFYSLDKDIICSLVVDFGLKTVNWSIPKEHLPFVTNISASGDLRLVSPKREEQEKSLR